MKQGNARQARAKSEESFWVCVCDGYGYREHLWHEREWMAEVCEARFQEYQWQLFVIIMRVLTIIQIKELICKSTFDGINCDVFIAAPFGDWPSGTWLSRYYTYEGTITVPLGPPGEVWLLLWRADSRVFIWPFTTIKGPHIFSNRHFLPAWIPPE